MNKDTKHTQGPWSVKWEKGFPIQIMGSVTTRDANYNPVTRAKTTFIFPTSIEASANARLMAAAPEMLEALKATADWRKSPNNGRESDKLRIKSYDLMAKAIAKATSEEETE